MSAKKKPLSAKAIAKIKELDISALTSHHAARKVPAKWTAAAARKNANLEVKSAARIETKRTNTLFYNTQHLDATTWVSIQMLFISIYYL